PPTLLRPSRHKVRVARGKVRFLSLRLRRDPILCQKRRVERRRRCRREYRACRPRLVCPAASPQTPLDDCLRPRRGRPPPGGGSARSRGPQVLTFLIPAWKVVEERLGERLGRQAPTWNRFVAHPSATRAPAQPPSMVRG